MTGPDHAETTITNAVQSQGMTVNPELQAVLCATCSQAIQDAGPVRLHQPSITAPFATHDACIGPEKYRARQDT